MTGGSARRGIFYPGIWGGSAATASSRVALRGHVRGERPLIATRWDSIACEELGETVEGMDLLERLLRCGSTKAHDAMADILWEAPGDERAMEELTDLAKANIVAFEAHEREGDRGADSRQQDVADVEG